MRKIILFIFLISGVIQAQANLNFFIQAAYKNNPQLKELDDSFLNSKLEMSIIHADNILPKISLSANVMFAPYFNNDGKFLSTDPNPNAIGYDIGITNGGNYSALLNVDKAIFNGGIIDALQEQVAIKDNSSKNTITLTKHDLEKQVTDQYLQAYLALKMCDLEKDVLSILKNESSLSDRLAANGLLKESDRLLLNIEIDNQSNALVNAETQYNANIVQLLSLCGLGNMEAAKIDSVSLAVTEEKSNSLFFNKYALDSLALVNQQAVAETKYLPQISLFFNTGLNAVELEGMQRKFGFSTGINFALPIFDGGQKSLTRQQNEISIKSVSYYKEYFRTQVNNMKSGSLKKIQSLKKNLGSMDLQVKNYEKVISISEKELNQGFLSMVDYLTILKNFIDLKKTQLATWIDYQLEINNYNYWNW